MKARREPSQDVADFNDRMDTPKPVYKVKTPVEEPVPAVYIAPDSNLDDDTKKYFKLNRNNKGDVVINQISTDPVRTPKKGAKK